MVNLFDGAAEEEAAQWSASAYQRTNLFSPNRLDSIQTVHNQILQKIEGWQNLSRPTLRYHK